MPWGKNGYLLSVSQCVSEHTHEDKAASCSAEVGEGGREGQMESGCLGTQRTSREPVKGRIAFDFYKSLGVLELNKFSVVSKFHHALYGCALGPINSE